MSNGMSHMIFSNIMNSCLVCVLSALMAEDLEFLYHLIEIYERLGYFSILSLNYHSRLTRP